MANAARPVQQLPDGKLLMSGAIFGDRTAENRAHARIAVLVPARRATGLQPLERAAEAIRFDLQKRLLPRAPLGSLRESTLC